METDFYSSLAFKIIAWHTTEFELQLLHRHTRGFPTPNSLGVKAT